MNIIALVLGWEEWPCGIILATEPKEKGLQGIFCHVFIF